MDLAANTPMPAKHAEDLLRLLPVLDLVAAELAWRKNRKANHPETFRSAVDLVMDSIATRKDLQFVPIYSHDVEQRCSRCRETENFPLACAKQILAILRLACAATRRAAPQAGTAPAAMATRFPWSRRNGNAARCDRRRAWSRTLVHHQLAGPDAPEEPGAARLVGRRISPSVEVPIGDFFGLGLGEYFTYQSALLAVAPIKALNAYFQMPFATAAASR
jgi:hypothetical protein